MCDNYFTSHGLVLKVVEKKCSLVGTLRQNKGYIPMNARRKRNCTKLKCLGMMAKRRLH